MVAAGSALLMLFSFAACTSGNKGNTGQIVFVVDENSPLFQIFGAAGVIQQQGGYVEQPQMPAPSVQNDPVQPAVTPSNDTTDAPAPTPDAAPPVNTAASPLEMSKEEMLNYFNTSLNKIKTDMPGFTRNEFATADDIVLSLYHFPHF